MYHCKKRIRNVKKRLKIIDFPFQFPKFHEILHLLDDIKQFGAPMNFCEIMDFLFRFPKFHEILHLVLDDIKRFDAPMNFCAQRPESLLIPAAMQPGRRAHKRHEGSAYELGAAQCLSHSFLIDVIYSRVWDGEAREMELAIRKVLPC